ncbi:hypothetical protein [uncultured Bartonella sp.]|uniref:hypothetical protein n=1 Tax=uncultured Bartonella sp. TaxID=104108 RepID=UPI0025DA4492|nr:hypothetical protein [uncultured Bartonella sp.]
MPVVGNGTLIVEFGVFTITSIIALGVNMWLQFWLPGKKTLQGAAILSFLLEKFYTTRDVLFAFCILTGIALFFVDTNYRITVFNLNTGHNTITVDFIQFFRLFCFVVGVFLVQQTIRNCSTVWALFRLKRQIKRHIASGKAKETAE